MAGGEVLRILTQHPSVEVACAVSNSKEGQFVWQVHPHLRANFSNLA